MINQKYEITDIAHGEYPFLHRICALQDIGDKVKAGDLGGFVESESNLSFAPGDDAWVFDDAIACGESRVDQGSRLFGNAVVRDCAYVSLGAALSAEARAEDSAYIRSADLCGQARASGRSVIVASSITGKAPILSGTCVVYGDVMGDVHIMGQTVVLNTERIYNETPDTLIINGQERSVVRDPSRDELTPRQSDKAEKKKTKRREAER